MNFFGQADVTSHPAIYFQRPSGGATFLANADDDGYTDLTGPGLSDPGTGAMTAGSYAPLLQPSNVMKNFALIIGILVLVIWMEEGRRVAII